MSDRSSLPRAGLALEAKGLAKAYEKGLVVAVRRADLSLAPGERVAIMGPTGCGKSTLLAMLSLLEAPDTGGIFFDGQPARTIKSPEQWRLANVGIVFQLHYLIPHLTALENVMLPLLAKDMPQKEREERGRTLLASLNLSHRCHTLAAKLSGGERQLVALARALINEPRLLLADEPTGAVDSATGALLLDRLFDHSGAYRPTILLVTHDPAVAARADRIVTMRDGVLPAPQKTSP